MCFYSLQSWINVCISENMREKKNASATMYHTPTKQDTPKMLKPQRQRRCCPTAPPSRRGPVRGRRRRRWRRHRCSLCWPKRLCQTSSGRGSASCCMTYCSLSARSCSSQWGFAVWYCVCFSEPTGDSSATGTFSIGNLWLFPEKNIWNKVDCQCSEKKDPKHTRE